MGKKKNNLDNYHWHEAFDRTYLIADMLDSVLLTHPVFNQKDRIRHIQLRKRIEKAQSIILDTYQEIGQLIHEKETTNDSGIVHNKKRK